MNRPGRPNLGANHVDALSGSPMSKERLRMILLTLSGTLTVQKACARLGVSPARFATLRIEALQAAVDGLEPLPIGRPPRKQADSATEALSAKVQALEEELRIAETRAEISAILPRSSEQPPGSRRASAGEGARARRPGARKKGARTR
jgi:hypothetical protein